MVTVAEPIVCVKNTFIDFAWAPPMGDLGRARTDLPSRGADPEDMASSTAASAEAEGFGESAAECQEGERVLSVKNTFINIEEEPAREELRRAQSDMPHQSQAASGGVGAFADQGLDAPPAPSNLSRFATLDPFEPGLDQDLAPEPGALSRYATLDGYEPMPGREPWMVMGVEFPEDTAAACRAAGECGALSTDAEAREAEEERRHGGGAPSQAQDSPVHWSEGAAPPGYVQAVVYVPVAVPLASVAGPVAAAQAWPAVETTELAATARLPEAEAAARAAATVADVPLAGSPDAAPLAPGALGLERVSRPGSVVQRFRWNVDARKLKSSDRRAVSPAFNVFFAGPVQFRPVQFKMLLRPRPADERKGGASFKRTGGRGCVELNCLQLVDPQDVHPVQFRVAVGAEIARGPVRHDFSEQTQCMLPEGSDEWDFGAQVEPKGDIFTVHLEIVAGAEAALDAPFDFDAHRR